MGRLLAVSDIHGYGWLLEGLLKHADYNSAKDHLYLLGDYVNKGPDSAGTLELIRKLMDGGAVALQGNNERKWLHCIPDQSVDPAQLISFISSLPLVAEYGPYLFVHAGLRPGVPLNAQSEKDLTEIRDEFHHAPVERGRIVVFGHTSTFRFGVSPDEIWFGYGKICIDTGAGHGHYLSLVDLTNGIQYYVSVLSPHTIRTALLQPLRR
ncbi:metallophosphoesterase [Paenibacillus radicis (ex Xue et al. 2023)]|uniref:Metallophosphoesterase n=1 Tax=Paenibacillus radicis (ex Xue et al. 2023) TaxID=2972489 RepID=A0ABT1YRP7_9BACL|nr:metallophosphoesterase [Paenibacillus radicis (ex Xue et al. 2023)]MCR8635854.1 metallophosphoesterase [Paenibacillus radicis (ex Xue et al. 2023)]